MKEWGMTQDDCLKYNKEHGIEWLEDSIFIRSFSFDEKIDLYTILDRVSCWCCANKNQWELYNIWKYLPDIWEKLKDLQRQTNRPFKSGKYGYTIFEIEERFRNGYVPKHRTKKR